MDTIREAIRQQRPFDPGETEVLLTLIRTAERVTCIATRPLEPALLSTAQYNVLRILRGSPEGLQTHDLASRLVSRAPNITRLVDKLEGKGLLTRSRSKEDRRVVLVRITEPGLERLRILDDPIRRSIVEAMRGLTRDEQSRLCDLLNRLREPLEGDAGSGSGGGHDPAEAQ
jgi:DNA-binding MarR family transcriptional regulator